MTPFKHSNSLYELPKRRNRKLTRLLHNVIGWGSVAVAFFLAGMVMAL